MSGADPSRLPRILPLAGNRELALPPGRCLVMGILNATPDSFSDGGELAGPGAVEERVRAMRAAGADLLDVGGESTRPGHAAVPADEEVSRVVPVIEAVRRVDAEVPLSIDTQKAAVAEAALDAGADWVNDVSALADARMGRLVADRGCSVVLMRRDDCHGDIVTACRSQLQAAMVRARTVGIPDHAIVLDPGLGFGARPDGVVEDNLALIDRLRDYAMERPVLVGASRKRFVGTMTGESDPRRRVAASVELAVRAARAGAAMVRVHDVAETVQALAGAGFHPGGGTTAEAKA